MQLRTRRSRRRIMLLQPRLPRSQFLQQREAPQCPSPLPHRVVAVLAAYPAARHCLHPGGSRYVAAESWRSPLAPTALLLARLASPGIRSTGVCHRLRPEVLSLSCRFPLPPQSLLGPWLHWPRSRWREVVGRTLAPLLMVLHRASSTSSSSSLTQAATAPPMLHMLSTISTMRLAPTIRATASAAITSRQPEYIWALVTASIRPPCMAAIWRQHLRASPPTLQCHPATALRRPGRMAPVPRQPQQRSRHVVLAVLLGVWRPRHRRRTLRGALSRPCSPRRRRWPSAGRAHP